MMARREETRRVLTSGVRLWKGAGRLHSSAAPRARENVGCPSSLATVTTDDVLVEDEPAVLILEALTSLRVTADGDGMSTMKRRVGGDSGAALLHALGRIRARLTVEDMRSFLPGRTPNMRTEDQRGADAFIILADRVDKALTEWRNRLHRSARRSGGYADAASTVISTASIMPYRSRNVSRISSTASAAP